MTDTTMNRRNLMVASGTGVLSIPVFTQAGLAENGDQLQVDIRQIERPNFPEVTVFASVTDRNGSLVASLDASDFTITEDDSRSETIQSVTQPDTDTSTDVATSIVIDRSGSMGRGTRMEDAITGAVDFVSNFQGGDQGQVIAFDSNVEVRERWTRETATLTDTIEAISPGGTTALFDAVIEGVEEAAGRVGRSAALVLADGQDNASANSITDAIDRANEENVPVYTIGLGGAIDPDALQQIATETGGEFLASADGDDLRQIYQTISESIANEYQVTYLTSDNTTDANERVVALEAMAGGDIGSDTGTYIEPCAPLPTAAFDIPDEIRAGENLSFDGSASRPNGGTLVSYDWDFTNNGVTDASGQTATHTYAEPGNYQARLTVEKTCGAQDASIQPIFVFDDPIAIFIEETNAPVTEGETLEVEAELENAGTDAPGLAVELFDFDGEQVDVEVVRADRGTATTVELEWDTEIGDAGTGEISVEATDGRKASTTVEIVSGDVLEQRKTEKTELAEHLETISASNIDEKSEVEALFDEYESLLEADEVETEQAEEAVERLIMAEDVITRALEVTGQGEPREEEANDYNMATQVYASLFQGLIEWKFCIIEIKNSLAELTSFQDIISAALDYMTDAVEDLIVEQTVGFMEDEVDGIDEETIDLADDVVDAYELGEDIASGDIQSIAEELVDPAARLFGDMGQQNLERDGSSRVFADSSPGYRDQAALSIENTSPDVWSDNATYQSGLDPEVSRNTAIRRIQQNAENLEDSITQEHDGLLDLIDMVLDLKRAGLRRRLSVLRELAEFIWDRLPIVRSGFNTGQGIVLVESVVDESNEGVELIVGRESV